MKAAQRTALIVALLATAGLAIYFVSSKNKPEASHLREATKVDTATNAESEPKYPVGPEEKSQPTANSKADTDFNGQSLDSALEKAIGKELFESVFNIDGFAKRVVVTVDSATSDEQLPMEQSAIKGLDSDFQVERKGSRIRIAKENYLRYSRFADLAKSVDPHEFVAVYTYFYPILQSAYRELGNEKYFNDRVVEVIDHILKTPEVADNPKLSRPSAKFRYKFEDESLESLSSSQKALVRMGSENEHAIKAKLKVIRGLLVHLGKKKVLT